MATVAAALMAHNEAAKLPGCIETLSWADEIVFVDCGSTDESAAVAEQCGARVFRRPNILTINENRNFGFDQVRSDWIFIIDPDEFIPPALGDEIRTLIENEDGPAAYVTHRRNIYFGRWLRHGGNWPDTQLRLFRRGKARYACRFQHEKVTVDGEIGITRNTFDHHPYPTVSDYIRKFDYYADRAADVLVTKPPGVSLALRCCLFVPCARFARSYILRRGLMDGLSGLFACAFDAMVEFVGYVKCHERTRPDADGRTSS